MAVPVQQKSPAAAAAERAARGAAAAASYATKVVRKHRENCNAFLLDLFVYTHEGGYIRNFCHFF